MKQRTFFGGALFLLAGFLGAIAALPGQAQQAGIFEVLLPAATLTQRLNDGSTLGQFLGRITAYADGAECAIADVSTATADVVLELGGPNQADLCSQEGATVAFREGRGYLLVMDFPLVKGTRVTLTNFAPYPPGSEPTSTPMPKEPPPKLPMDCPTDRAIAGEQVVSSFGSAAEVTLPAGRFVRLLIPPETVYFGFCHVETGAQVTLSGLDCSEGSRLAQTAAAQTVVDQIVSSCRIPQAPAGPFCPEEGEPVRGNQELTVSDDIVFTLPGGAFVVYRDPLKPRTVTICAVQDNGVSMRYETLLSLNDCSQLGRSTIDTADFALADAIAASCRLIRDTSGDLPTSAPQGTAGGIAPRGITPPDTGNAGLLRP